MKIISSRDDCSVEDLKIAALMAKYKIHTTFYWPVSPEACNDPKGRKSLSPTARTILSQSFEIGSHTITHPLLTRIPLRAAEEEIKDSKGMMEDLYDVKITKFCYPRGYANPEIQQMVKDAGYTSARSTLVGYIHESENPFFEQTTVHVGNDRKEYGGQSWLDYALNLLEEAIRTPDSVFHFWGHGWELEQNNGWYDLETLLQRVSEV